MGILSFLMEAVGVNKDDPGVFIANVGAGLVGANMAARATETAMTAVTSLPANLVPALRGPAFHVGNLPEGALFTAAVNPGGRLPGLTMGMGRGGGMSIG